MNRIRDSRGGKTNDPRFGHRLQGQGFYAEMIKQRFQRAIKKAWFESAINTAESRFVSPSSTANGFILMAKTLIIIGLILIALGLIWQFCPGCSTGLANCPAISISTKVTAGYLSPSPPWLASACADYYY